jgi:hypothetical protein
LQSYFESLSNLIVSALPACDPGIFAACPSR